MAVVSDKEMGVHETSAQIGATAGSGAEDMGLEDLAREELELARVEKVYRFVLQSIDGVLGSRRALIWNFQKD